MIDVETFLREHSVEELCATAESYFARLDGEELMVHEARKPFANLLEAPQSLHKLGLLLGGLRLGQGMTVMDFGAGLGWLSRYLNQLGCETISVDVSTTALRLGRQAFDRHYVGKQRAPAHFLPYDGRRLEWPEASVDRVICFDAFHHIPNQGEALAEMQRVLRPGGIAGFAEPGRRHSCTAPAQMEMAKLATLENDIRPEQIFALAQQAGFTDFACTQGIPKPTLFSLAQYLRIAAPDVGIAKLTRLRTWWRRRFWPRTVQRHINEMLRQGMADGPIFFLHNGPFVPDSRSPEGLSHRLQLGPVPASVKAGETLGIATSITNAGAARWLHQSRDMIGVVQLAVQLVDLDHDTVDDDYYRHPLGRDVAPDEQVSFQVRVPLPQSGRIKLRFDLVSEHVAWFERLGSSPVEVELDVV